MATLRKMCNTLTTVKVLMVSAFPDFMQPKDQLSLRLLLWYQPKQILWEESKKQTPILQSCAVQGLPEKVNLVY